MDKKGKLVSKILDIDSDISQKRKHTPLMHQSSLVRAKWVLKGIHYIRHGQCI
jgi:hypothetical protein